MNTQVIDIEGLTAKIPSNYQLLKSMPDDWPGSVAYGAQSEHALCMVLLRKVGEEEVLPRQQKILIDGIRKALGDKQGLIEADTGDDYTYSIVKTLMDQGGVQYHLSVQKFLEDGILDVHAYFEEYGMTGMRDTICLELCRRENLVSFEGDKLVGWFKDPYDPKWNKGVLMNLSEEPRFDSMFPDSPLSMCRAFLSTILSSDKSTAESGMEALKDAHETALKKAKKAMPEISASDIVELVLAVLTEQKKPEEAARELAGKYKKSAEVYLRTFQDIGFQNVVDEALRHSSSVEVQKLSKSDYAKKVEQTTLKIAKQVKRYWNGDIDTAELITQLGKTDAPELLKTYLDASGMHIPDMKQIASLTQMSSWMTSYAALMASYELTMEALDEAHAYHLESQKIQAECERTTALIVQYRRQIEETANAKLKQYADTFSDAFSAIDQAILADDTNGYIKGNKIIWDALGKKAQFDDEDSFDAFMDSDEAFKL